MSMLKELNQLLSPLNIPLEIGVFSDVPPKEYLVITPLSDRLEMFADNEASMVVSEVRISLFTQMNYTKRTKDLTQVLRTGGMTITDRRYVGYEMDTKYHHYVIDVMKEYEMEED